MDINNLEKAKELKKLIEYVEKIINTTDKMLTEHVENVNAQYKLVKLSDETVAQIHLLDTITTLALREIYKEEHKLLMYEMNTL